MKRKIIVVVIVLIFCISFTGCGKEEAKELADNDITQETAENNSMRNEMDTKTSVPEKSTEIAENNDPEVIQEDLPYGFKRLSDAELKGQHGE